jgi:anaerobic magnesium-protoporphyrin IX monomethyl ester cyclase
MKKVKIALVLDIPNSPGKWSSEAPISLLYLGAQLGREGHTVFVLDRRTYQTDRLFYDALKNTKADLIGIALYASNYTRVYKLVNEIQRFSSSARIVLGGPEVSANREEVMQLFNKVDYLLVGEAEYTLACLANSLFDLNETELASIEGLSFRKNGEVHHNPPPAPIKDIDSIPFPQRDLIRPDIWKKFYYRPGLGRPTDVILTSRGCPFKCRFCYRLTPGYRARSPENVLAEIGEIYARGAKGLIILDDNFTVSRKRCVAILEGILEKGWKLAIKCRGRVNKVDPELFNLMKKAGVRSITFGIESGAQKVLDAMNKQTTVEQNYEAIRMVRAAGLQCYADLFLGFPGETPDTIRETSDFLMKAKPTGINMAILYPLHSTEVYEQAKCDGTLVGDWGILEDCPWVRLEWYDDINVLRKEWHKISRRFWLSPGVISRGIKANIRYFGLRDYFDVCKTIWHRYLRTHM